MLTGAYDPLDSPKDNEHIVLLYDNEDKRNLSVARFLNEGLKRNQICVYGSVRYQDRDHIQQISSLIHDSEEHQKKGNLLFVDMAQIYVSSMTGDLGPFQHAAKQLEKMVESRQDKHIRFVGDCAGFLFKNRHFEECLSVEGWGQQKPFFGSYVCPYQKSLFDSHPHDSCRKSILGIKHDTVVDAESGRVLEKAFMDHNVISSDTHQGSNTIRGAEE